MQWQDSLSALYGEGWGRFLNSSVPIGRMLVHVPPTPAPTIMPVAGDKEHTSLIQASDHLRLLIQPVVATHCSNRSAGVSKSNVSLGRPLSCRATALSLF